MPRTAKAYIALVIASGTTVLLLAAGSWSSASLRQFAIYLGLAALASTLKIRIPGMECTISPNFVFLLLGMTVCTFSEVVVIALTAALVQSLWTRRKQPRLVQIAFSGASRILSSSIAFTISHLITTAGTAETSIARIILAASLYFPLNAALVSSVVSLVNGDPLNHVWRRCYDFVFPYFMGGAVFAGLISGAYTGSVVWKGALLLLPVVILAHLYFLSRSRREASLAMASAEEACSTDLAY